MVLVRRRVGQRSQRHLTEVIFVLAIGYDCTELLCAPDRTGAFLYIADADKLTLLYLPLAGSGQ